MMLYRFQSDILETTILKYFLIKHTNLSSRVVLEMWRCRSKRWMTESITSDCFIFICFEKLPFLQFTQRPESEICAKLSVGHSAAVSAYEDHINRICL